MNSVADQSTDLTASIGEIVGGYRLDAVLGQGTGGCVYVATHALLGRRAAVKILADKQARNEDFVTRFFDEARIVNDIHHANIVDIVDFVRTETPLRVAYIMEYIEGATMASVLETQRLSVPQAFNVCFQLSDALKAVHSIGVVHRDLKPGNILIVEPLDSDLSVIPSVKILDFGIAKIAKPDDRDDTGGHSGKATAAPALMGTPRYMAPEQITAEPVSPATDVYALAELLYEMVAGQPAFTGSNMAVFQAKLSDRPPQLILPPDVRGGDAIRGLVAACLDRDPGRRPSLEDFNSGLLSIAHGTTDTPSFQSISVEVPTVEDLTALDGSITIRGVTASAPSARVLALGVLSVGVLVLALSFVMDDREAVVVDAPPLERVAPATARITVRTSPAGAKVLDLANGTQLGLTPLEIEVPTEGGRPVALELDGYTRHVATLSTGADLQFVLAPVPEPPLPEGDAPPPSAIRPSSSARSPPPVGEPPAATPVKATPSKAPAPTTKPREERAPLKRNELPDW